MIKRSLFILFAVLLTSAQAFVPPKNAVVTKFAGSQLNGNEKAPVAASNNKSTSLMMGRQWNFNEGRGPWGMKKNAEIWNGRVGQMGFTVVLLQELITGKGVIQGLQDGDTFSYILLGATGVSVLGLTAFLALKGKDSNIPLS